MFLRETEREGGRHGERELGREGCREGGSSGGTGGGGRENRRRRLRPPRYRRKKESMVTNARTCALEMMDIDFIIWESEHAYAQTRARAHTHTHTHKTRWSSHRYPWIRTHGTIDPGAATQHTMAAATGTCDFSMPVRRNTRSNAPSVAFCAAPMFQRSGNSLWFVVPMWFVNCFR